MANVYFAFVVFLVYAGGGVVCQPYAKCTIKLDVSTCYSEPPPNVTAMPCSEERVCQKKFNISYIEHTYPSDIVSDLITQCCGPCAVSSQIHTLRKVSQLSEAVMNESHFVFPVLGRPTTSWLYGYRFIPLIETPNVYYVTNVEHNLMQQLVVSCLEMWPLMIICAFMVLIAGFICWVTETWNNQAEFPRSFMRGWFEGIWWAFISMTTVGYGDKAPRSISARLFSIVWIFIGITTFSLVTAMLTSEISAANSLPPPTMQDANVGVVRNRIHESILVANQGGILVDVDPKNVTEGIHELIAKLDQKIIDGFILDKYTLILFYFWFKDHHRYKSDIDYLRTKTILTEVTHMEESFLYGILVKNDEDYEFLADYMTSNRDVINTCNNLFLNEYSRKVRVHQESHNLFSTEGQMFWPTFVICLVVIAIFCIFGALYGYRHKKKFGNKSDDGSGNGFLSK